MKLVQQYNKLCSPSAGFLVVSVASLLVVLFHQKRHLRNPLVIILIMLKILYILFWTWVLDLICKSGHKGISWALVLAPYVLALLVVIMNNRR
jgi:TRAP-type uncharacterized transport system fused permease subunit